MPTLGRVVSKECVENYELAFQVTGVEAYAEQGVGMDPGRS